MSTIRQRKIDTTSGAKIVESPSQPILQDGGWRTFRWALLLAIILLPIIVLDVLSFAFSPPIDAVPLQLPPQPIKSNSVVITEDIQGERLFEKELSGPESIVLYKGHIYTGTHDGKIMDIEQNKIRILTQLGKPPCDGFENEPTCGRPLGMRMSKDGYLIVIDTYLGLFKVNVATGDKHLLLPPSTIVGDHDIKFMNDLDIDSSGIIYFSDSSAKFQRRNFMHCLLEGAANGRLIEYDPVKQTTRVLLDGLLFANGVQLSRDESYILVTETGKARVHKYYLKGDKKGQNEIFADNLPTLPDNIRLSGKGGYWVGGAVIRWADQFSMEVLFTASPWIRNFIAKVIPLSWMLKLAPKRGIFMELDQAGHITSVYQDVKGTKFYSVSEIADDAGILYIGSYTAPGLFKIDTRKYSAKSAQK